MLFALGDSPMEAAEPGKATVEHIYIISLRHVPGKSVSDDKYEPYQYTSLVENGAFVFHVCLC